MSLAPTEPEWQRLDPRMLLVYPVRELVRFLPALVAIFVAGTAAGRTDWWHGLGIAIPVALGVLRYVTTSYRVTPSRVELRRGLVSRHLLSTPRDRVRTVDLTASLTHRVLGLTTVRVGTGSASTDDEDHLDLDGLPAERARALRAELLRAAPAETPDSEATHSVEPDRVVLRLDPAWVRFAPLTTTGLVLAGGLLGATAQLLDSIGGFHRLDTGAVADTAAGWPWWLAGVIGLVVLLILVTVLAIVGYVVTNWGFTLTHAASGAWHVRRGLLTTRETSIDQERVSGVSVTETVGLRLAGGARVSAIVTGLGRSEAGTAMLAPPAPRPVIDGVAAEVLGSARPLPTPLVGHGPRARTRRYSRALGPAAVLVLAVALLLAWVESTPRWLLAVAVLALPAAALLAWDRTRSLGHALVDGHVVARSGSLDRRHDALSVRGVIGWNLRSSWFQRRAGLTTLVATTAGGRQSVPVLDVPEELAVALALEATPGFVTQFLADPVVSPETHPPTSGATGS